MVYLTIIYTTERCFHTENYHRERRKHEHKVLCVCRAVNAVILSCCDQQVFTGLAFAIDYLAVGQNCDISAYHLNIILLYLLMSCATHGVTVSVAGRRLQTTMTYIPRALFSVALFVLTTVIFFRELESVVPFPMEIQTANPHKVQDPALARPAICFKDSSHSETSESQTGNRFSKLFFGLFFVYVISYANLFVPNKPWSMNFEQWKDLRGYKPAIAIILSYSFEAGMVLYCTFLVVFSFVHIQRLREFMGSFIQHRNHDNPEDNTAGFAQFVALMLISLTAFAACQAISGKFIPFSLVSVTRNSPVTF